MTATVLVRWLRVDEARPRAHQDALDWMSPHERHRHDRFAFEPTRRVHRLARWLCRGTLAELLGRHAKDLRFTDNAYGRPEYAGPERVVFSLSHTREIVAIAVHRGDLSTVLPELGLDVERERVDDDLLDIAPRFFTPAEVTGLHDLAETDRMERFFALWTLKEAYIKARGMGLALPLDGFSFGEVGPCPQITFRADIADRTERWRFTRARWSPDHVVALAVGSGGPGPWYVRTERLGHPTDGEQAAVGRVHVIPRPCTPSAS